MVVNYTEQFFVYSGLKVHKFVERSDNSRESSVFLAADGLFFVEMCIRDRNINIKAVLCVYTGVGILIRRIAAPVCCLSPCFTCLTMFYVPFIHH